MSLLDSLRKIVGGFAGSDAPADRVPPPLPPRDAREHALRAFASFVGGLDFRTPGASEGFKLAEVFTGQPADPVALKFPAVTIVPTRGTHDSCSLGGFDVLEDTYGVFGAGTVLVREGEYSERLTVEAWADNDPQRTTVLGGIATALRLGERVGSVVLSLPDYYGASARFTLVESEHVDDPDVVRGRVRAHLFVDLDVQELQLVDAVTFRPRFRAVVGPGGST